MIRIVVRSPGRLDRCLADLRPELSRRRWAGLIRGGAVRVNGLPCRPSLPLKPGDIVEAEPPPAKPESAPPPALDVLFEDPHIVVLNKPAGLDTQATRSGRPSVAAGLQARYGRLPSQGGSERAGLVHRLDRPTSGVMVAARTPEAMAGLYRQFKGRRVEKTYLALVHGKMGRVRIELPVAMKKRKWVGRVTKKRGKPAVTLVAPIRIFADRTLVEARPVTGRPHQIRIHLAAVGHPIVGDATYGSPEPGPLWLHARRLEFSHPVTGRRMSFEAPAPFTCAGADRTSDREGPKSP